MPFTPSSREHLKPREHLEQPVAAAMVVLGAAVFAGLCSAYWPFTVDDAYIFLRYAKNLADGEGLTWNTDGTRAEGYTALSWTVLLALPQRLGLDGLLAAKAGGVGAMLGTALLLLVLTRALTGTALAPSGAVFVFLATPATAIHAVAGMETGLACLLTTAVALLSTVANAGPTRTRLVGLALCSLALGLTRPEANLFAVLVWSALLWRTKRGFGEALSLYLVPGLVYFLVRAWWYGQWLPLPFYVKALAQEAGPFAGWGPCLELLADFSFGRPWVGLGVAVAVWRSAAARTLGLAVAAWWVFFLFPEHQMGFDGRYLVPVVPCLLALSALGWALALERAPRMVPLLVFSLGLAGAMALTGYRWLESSMEEKRAYGAGGRRAHVGIGVWLRERSASSRTAVATLDAGAIAFVSGWTVIDTWGLNDAELARAAMRGHRSPELIFSKDPSVVVVISQRADRFVPHFAYELPLKEEAERRGFTLRGRWEFLPDYVLWVLADQRVPEP